VSAERSWDPRAGQPGAPLPRPGAMERLRAWLCRKNPQLSPDTLGDDQDLIDSGAVDSFALVELILLIEQECGRPVLSEDLDPRSIRTLAAIERSFFTAPSPAKERP